MPNTPRGAGRRFLGKASGRPRFAAAFLLTICLLLVVAFASPARAEIGVMRGWDVQTASQSVWRSDIELRYDPSLAVPAKALIERAPGWWQELKGELGQEIADDLKIHFVTHAGQVSQATGMPKWVSGVANGARGEIAIAYHNPDGSRSELASLLRHEMAHVALRRALDGKPVPRWFHEGVADTLGAAVDLGRANTLAGAAFGTGILPISQWDRALMSEGVAVSNTYAASRDFMAYLRNFNEDRGRSFRRWIETIRSGVPFEQSVEQVFGHTLDELHGQWRQSLRERYFWYALLASGSLPMVLGGPLLGVAWVRQKRYRARRLAEMEREEKLQRWRSNAARPYAISGIMDDSAMSWS